MKDSEQLQLKDIFLFLIGREESIRRLSGSWSTIIVGAMLVVSAGVARNYDHHYFLREWEWLYGPFAASLVSSSFIFLVGYPKALFRKSGLKNYVSFLSLYWMTSPCAWLYAIPIESFTDIVTATKWNIAFLAIVSLWRVLLMARCLAVLTNEMAFSCLLRVLMPASFVMMVASFHKGTELIGIMGGIKLSPSETILRTSAEFTTEGAFWTMIASYVGVLCLQYHRYKAKFLDLPWQPTRRFSRNSYRYVGLGLLVVLVASIPMQRKAARNYELKQMIEVARQWGGWRPIIDYIAEFERSDFLMAHHFPPGPRDPVVLGLHHALEEGDPQWLWDEWEQKLEFVNGGPKEDHEPLEDDKEEEVFTDSGEP